MNITQTSLEMFISERAKEAQHDPDLMKMFAELEALRSEINKPKDISRTANSGPQVFAPPKTNVAKKVRAKRRNTTGDSTFRSHAFISGVRRSSDRLSGKTPSYKYTDDIDELENNRLYANGELKRDGTFKPRKSFHRTHFKPTERIILMPEEITKEMLDNILYKQSDRIYDKENGSSCHQCRQKTVETKSICRNLDCYGVRGQFCGTCALNRYGVDIAEALMDPYWVCFVCQGVCNCSFCRSDNGKRPTGILTPIAKRQGHDNVKEFLDELKLSLKEEDDFEAQLRDPESVLGFSDEINVSYVGGKKDVIFGSTKSSISAFIINDIIGDHDANFIGFTNDAVVTSENELEIIKDILKSLNS